MTTAATGGGIRCGQNHEQESEIKANRDKMAGIKKQREAEAADIQRLFHSLAADHTTSAP